MLARALGDTLCRLAPEELTVHLVDPARGLIEFGEAPHVASYVTSTARAEKLARELADQLAGRLPPRAPAWPSCGPALGWPVRVLVVDDYDMLLGAWAAHLPLWPRSLLRPARSGSISCAPDGWPDRNARASSRSLQRLRELRPTTLVLSGSPEEGLVAGGVKGAANAARAGMAR